MVSARFNKREHLGNTDVRCTRQLNRLWELRSPARYLTRDFNLSEDEARAMLEVAHEMLTSVYEAAPKRVRANYEKSDESGPGQAEAS